jgi:hypothetical protein
MHLDGKALWFLDTRHAGGAARPAPVDVMAFVNRVTSTESGGIIDLGNADLFGEGKIIASELDAFVAKRVGELTDNKQYPVMGRPPQEPDFTIAQVRKP